MLVKGIAMEQRNIEQTGIYHEPVAPHSNQRGTTIISVLIWLAWLTMLIVGIVEAQSQVRTAAVILVWVSIPLLFIVGLASLVYPIWHKWYMDNLLREHAKLDMIAKREQMEREQQEQRNRDEAHRLSLHLQATRLYADERGNRPFVYESGQVLQIASGNFVQPVPTHYHYSHTDTSTRAAQEATGTAGPQEYEQPTLATIIEELTPNTLQFAFGMDPLTGQIVKTTLPKSVHIQLLGASGQGKSRQATSILTQLCATNDTQHLGLALIDCEGETTEPFQRLPHVQHLATEPREAARTLKALVNELERRDISRILWPVLFIFVEEFLNLRRTMPTDYRDQALEDYTTLALRGRKRGMFLFSIGQTAYTEKAIRDAQGQFLSSMAFACKPTAARSAGFTNTELLNRLYSERKPGQFLLERPAGDSILLAPFVEPREIPGLLTSSVETSIVEVSEVVATHQRPISDPDRNPLEEALQAKREQVRQLIASGTVNKPDIILSVWGVRSGSSEKYKQAEQEYKHILASLVEAH